MRAVLVFLLGAVLGVVLADMTRRRVAPAAASHVWAMYPWYMTRHTAS